MVVDITMMMMSNRESHKQIADDAGNAQTNEQPGQGAAADGRNLSLSTTDFDKFTISASHNVSAYIRIGNLFTWPCHLLVDEVNT